MLSAGTVLARRYRVERALGQGGMAQAFVARDLVEDEDVALKVLRDDRLSEALRSEFERVREHVHPCLMRVRELSRARLGRKLVQFYSADLVVGTTLARFAREHDYAATREALGDVLEALHVLHRLGLRHGDVKPENVLVRDDGRAVLIDLGCAAPLGSAEPVLSGTPGYMAKEVLEGRAADERADVFAFGVMLRELFAAQLPEALLAQLTAERAAERPASAREVLSLLGFARDVDRFRFARTARLVGREAARGDAEQAFSAFARGEAGTRALWVHGPDGVGRSRFLRELAFAWSRDVELLHVSLRQGSLRAALARVLGDMPQGPEGLLAAVEELGENEARTVVVLDDVDLLPANEQEQVAWFLRSLPRAGRVFALLASRAELPPQLAPAALALALLPLDEAALSVWSEGLLAPEVVPRLLAHTGGFPREVEATLAALASGLTSEAELSHGPVAVDARRERALSVLLSGLEDEERQLLARVLVQSEAAGEHAERLLARGLLRSERGSLLLARASDREPLSALLDARLLRRLHAARARELSSSQEPQDVAVTISHLLHAAEWARAFALFEQALPLVSAAPQAFAQALRGHEQRLSPRARVWAARTSRLAGEPRRAISLLASARRAVKGAELDELFHEASEVYLVLGRPVRALWTMARLEPEQHSGRLELQARVLARTGDYAQAAQLAERALAHAEGAPERARACETLAMAEAYLGRDAEALAHVEEASTLHGASDARAAARCRAFRGWVLLRAGRVAEAAEAYARTLVDAESHGFADLLVNALMNLGNTRQLLGSYGAALASFERALRLARALGRAASVRVLRANLANLALEVGSLARAESELLQLSSEPHGAELESTLALYRAELSLLMAAPERALFSLGEGKYSGREHNESLLLRGAALLKLSRVDEAEACLRELSSSAEALPLDLAVRSAELAAELALARNAADVAVRALEQALVRARPSGQEPLLARLETLLARALGELASPALSDDYAVRARARWERMALDLSPSLRDAFWAHPRRRSLRVTGESEREPRGRTTLSLARLLDINRRINSSLVVTDVLERAMDAAIELTLAERGFVLLRDEQGALSVAVARHLAGEQLKRKEHKLSRSIAERVIHTGESLWTVDAGTDARFARQASVHAMRLKSVLCVPIRAAHAVIGALYLDNRLERARFSGADAELLLAFADQVAIALANARLVSELEHKTRELAREKRRVEELLRGKTEEVERLEHALTLSRAGFDTRYDYTHIVGRSAPMRRVFAVLDRVVESDVSVLITGESGTGKELVARAIHGQGARKNGPFVGLNCAALPEQLLEAELFGHVKGAFTGAERDRDGLLRAASGGTLFLDELGEMPLGMQAKLLRVLVDRDVRPVGATKSFPVDVRFVCATNRNLEERAREGAFREDLYYRVAVVTVAVPALRERNEDILPIAEALLRKRAKERGEPAHSLAPDAVRALLAHPWPGNVRELENTLLRASVMAQGRIIRAQDLGLGKAEERVKKTPRNRKDFEALEAQRLLAALEAERWNVSRVAQSLGIPRNTLYRKLARYGIRT